MAALGLLVRRSLPSHRRAVLGLALVVALSGGIALASLAAARRTASAFPRYLRDAHASDVAFNVIAPDPSDGAGATSRCEGCPAGGAPVDVSGIPGVVADQSYVGLEDLFVLDDHGGARDEQPEVVGSLDGRYLDQDRLAVLRGRLPRADRAGEVALNQQAATMLGAGPGTTLHLAVPDLSNPDLPPDRLPILARATVRVTGVGLFPEEVLSDDIDGAARVLATPPLTARLRESAGTYVWQGLRLAPGTSVDATIRAFDARLAPGYRANVQRTDTQVARVQRSVRPIALALAVFGGAAALAAVGLGALGAVRLVSATSSREEDTALQAIGLERRRRAAAAVAPAAIAALGGTLGAVGIATALSPLGPVGPVRQVDPERGVGLDGTILSVGAVVLAVAVLGAGLATAWRATSRSRRAESSPARPSTLARRLGELGLGPAAVVGARHAFGRDGQRDGVPTRSMLASCTLSVVVVVSALTFGASVRTLLRTPASYGWAADLAVISGGGYDELRRSGADRAARTSGVEGLTVAGFASVDLDDRHANAMGIDVVEGPALVTLIDGRLPRTPGEVALGASTARALGRSVGDRVAGPGGALRVVGIAALPAVGPIDSAHPSLGQGALLTFDGLRRLDPDARRTMALVRVGRGVDLDRSASRIERAIAIAMSESPPDFADSAVRLRPSEVIGLRPASRTAYVFAAALGAGALLALILTLSASVRRRRGTYAVLAALGMDGRDVRRSVRWQLALLTAATVGAGVPLGIAAGRLAWTAFGDLLGTAGGPDVPAVGIAAVVASLVLLAGVLGEVPARSAARHRRALLRRA